MSKDCYSVEFPAWSKTKGHTCGGTVPSGKGQWVLKVHSFYADNYDESTELVVYITATCSECGRRHPDSYEVYYERLTPPDEAETDEDFRFDRGYEEAKALEKFEQRGYAFAHYCPNCGAKMNKEDSTDD